MNVKVHQITVNRYVISCIAAASLLTGASISSAEAQALITPREHALHDCNTEAYTKWNPRDWMSAQITNYRDCMTEHGQNE
jgi:hypothetical protein